MYRVIPSNQTSNVWCSCWLGERNKTKTLSAFIKSNDNKCDCKKRDFNVTYTIKYRNQQSMSYLEKHSWAHWYIELNLFFSTSDPRRSNKQHISAQNHLKIHIWERRCDRTNTSEMLYLSGIHSRDGKASAATLIWLNTPPFDPANCTRFAYQMDDFPLPPPTFFAKWNFKTST